MELYLCIPRLFWRISVRSIVTILVMVYIVLALVCIHLFERAFRKHQVM